MPPREYEWKEFEPETEDSRSDYLDTEWLARRRKSNAEEYKGVVIKPEQGDSDLKDWQSL